MADELNQEPLPIPNELDVLKSRADMMKIPYSNNIGVEALRAKINEKMNEGGNDTSGKTEIIPPVVQKPVEQAQAKAAEAPATPAPTPAPVATPAPVQAPTPTPTPAPVAVAGPTKEQAEADKDELIRTLQAQLAQANTAPVEAAKAPEPVADTPVVQKTLRQYLYEKEMKLIRVRITNLDPKKKDLPGEIITVANEFLGTVKKFVPFGEHTDGGYHIPQVLLNELQNRKFLSITVGKDKRTNTPQVKDRWAKEFAIEILPDLTPDELSRLATAQIAAGSLDAAE